MDKVSGAAQPQLPVKTLNSFSLPIPSSLDDQRTVVKKIRSMEVRINSVIEIYETKLASLSELKKSILQKAFSGELTNNDKNGAAA